MRQSKKTLRGQAKNEAIDKPKGRSVVPIKSTIESIKGYPQKLIIFKLEASPFYWTRYYDGKPIKRSTKTENKLEAIKFAKSFYDEIQVNKKLGISNNKRKTSFLMCCDGVVEEDRNKQKRNEITEKYAKTQQQIINKHIKDFFKSYEIGDIDYQILDKFKTYLYSKELASSSIKLHFVALNKIFTYAQINKYITHQPVFPKVKKEDNARGYFKKQEYKTLRRTARKLVGTVFEIKRKSIDKDGNSLKLRNITITKDICYLIPMMLYSFIRPTDLKMMKHKHIEIKQESDGERTYEYLFLPIPETKKHSKPLVSMPSAAYYYKRLLKSRGYKTSKDYSDEYLFEPNQKNRDYAYKVIARQFEAILETANLKYSDDGDVRTLYSMRHTSLMYRLKYGKEISPIKLANNARTSVEMLTRFYLPQLENMDITKDLHAKKDTRRAKKESTFFLTRQGDDKYMSKINLKIDKNSPKLSVENGKIVVAKSKKVEL
jgi:hypothetical protein